MDEEDYQLEAVLPEERVDSPGKNIEDVLNVISQNREELEFMPTGFPRLDRCLDGGFLRGEVNVIGGPTGSGKSYLAGQLFLQIALKGFKSAYFSLEISNQMILSRLLGGMSNVSPVRLFKGRFDQQEYDQIKQAKTKLVALSDYFTFYDSLSYFSDIEKEIEERKFDFIVIDYVQVIQVKGTKTEYEKLDIVTARLRELAVKNNCCILLVSQQSNSIAQNSGGGQQLEYRGSGAIAHIATLGFEINRGKVDPNDIENSQEYNLILKKNRRGIGRGKFSMNMTNPSGRLEEINVWTKEN